MKKLILFFFALAVIQLNAQVVLTESFDDNPLPSGNGQDYPEGWVAKSEKNPKSLWRIKTSFPDGSTAIVPIDRKYLVGFEVASGGPYEEWLISKEITLLNTTRTNIVSFYSYHVSDGSHSVRITDNDGATWETIWTDTDTPGYPDKCLDSTTIDVAIPNAYKGKKVKLAWVFEATTCTSPWAFDYIIVEAVISGVDVMPKEFVSPLQHVDTVNSYPINKDIPVSIRIVNNGRTDAENIPVSYILNGGTPVNETVPLVKPKETLTYTFSQKINIPKQAINTLIVKTNATGDELPENNNTSELTFWTVDDSTFVIYDFEEPDLLDSAVWAESQYTLYNFDGQEPGVQVYENIFGSFPWRVGVGGGTIYPLVWGNYAVFSYSNFLSFSTPADRWLILPRCRIDNTAEPVFLQWNAASCYQKNYDALEFESYEVLISDKSLETTDFVKIHEVASEKFFNPNEPYRPYNRSVDISAYKGKEVHIAFRLTTSGTATRGMFVLDNITVFGSAFIYTNINDLKNESNVALYPNPVSDNLIVKSNEIIKKIEIYNLIGQKIETIEKCETEINVDVSNYNNGLYILKIKTLKGEISKKVNIVR